IAVLLYPGHPPPPTSLIQAPKGCFLHQGHSHLRLEALHQDGHQQVEEHIVAEGHEGHEVEGGPGGSGSHAVVEDDVPVLLGEDLPHGCGPRVGRAHLKMKMKSMSSMQKVATLSMVFMSTTSWRRSAGMKRTSFSTRRSRKVRSTDSPPRRAQRRPASAASPGQTCWSSSNS
ncbi:hypothetical protein FD754_012768, partial [Muntiacus muntjak]